MQFLFENWIVLLIVAMAIAWAMNVKGRKAEVRRLSDQIQSLQSGLEHWKNEAAKGYLDKADRGDPEAMLQLGLHFLRGTNSRMDALKRVSAGDPPDYQQAMKWFREAAERGNAEAMFQLGYMHHKGILPDTTERPEEARKWYQSAIANGHAEARDWLNRMEAIVD